VTRWYLIAAAVLGAGCEQLKSPQRIHDLESRVDELATEVSALTGKAVGGKPKPDGHGASKVESGHGDDDKKPDRKGEKKAEKGEKGDKGDKGAKGGHGETPEKPEVAKGEDAHGAGSGDDKHGSSDDDAVARLKALVAKQGKPERKAEPAHWGYDSKSGPAQWGELDPAWKTCQTGAAQSPIDIEPKAGSASPITFRYVPTAASVVDNGHTLQVNMAEGSSIEIDGEPYVLMQFHFHTPSEHTIAGEHYPLEVHLVHKGAGGKLAVVGVLFDAGADAKGLDPVWAKWPKKVGVEEKLRKPIDPTALLPDSRKVFRYEGSLTTPPCAEGVIWNVMRRTLSEGKARIDAFGRHYPNNAREVQALNDRKIE
jgi:carbonic anhydrase